MAYYLKDQLSIKTRKLLADLMADLVIIADSVQTFRLALAETPYFNGVELFRYLDQDEKGYLTPKDFAKLVSDQSKKLLHYAFAWFDISKVGEITKTQFLQFVFPHSNHELREVITQRMVHQCSPQQKSVTLPLQIDLLRCLILQIMQRQTKLIPMRRILMDQEDYTMKAIMNCLDVQARGWITTGDFYKFLKNYDVEVTMDNVCGMLGVYDKDMNGKISFKQLQILVEGLEKSQSQYRNIVRNSDKYAKTKIRNERCSCYKKFTHKSVEKTRSVSNIKKQSKIQTSIKANKIKQQSAKKEQYTSDFAQKLIDKKLNLKQNGLSNKKAKNKFVIDKQNNVQKSGKKKKQTKNKNLQIEKKSMLQQLRYAFESLERQTELIDNDLKNIEMEMGAKTQMQMQRQLQNAHIKKRMKLKEQQILRRRIQEMEIIREEQKIRRLREEEAARAIDAQKRRLLELQIQKNRTLQRENQHLRIIEQNRIRELQYQKLKMQKQQQIRNKQIQTLRKMQAEKIKIQEYELKKIQELQLQKIREVESQRLTSMQLNRLKQLQIQRLNQIHYQRQLGDELSRIRQIEVENAVRRSRLNQEAYDREVRAEAVKLSRSEYDWYAQAKIKALHEQQVRDRLSFEGKSQKESQYFWRYRNYCQNFAQIADPLGIKQHLAQTDKYLIKSKTIRDQIKKDRTNSLNRYSIKKQQIRRQRTNTQNDQSVYTPDQKHKDILDTINKRTQQTKLVWSNS